MLQIILQYFSLVLPHTFARFAHWHLLLFHNNTGLLDPHTIILAILPSYIRMIENFAAARHLNDAGDDEEPPGDRPGPFRVINDCLIYWFLVYKAFDLVAALNVVFRASGFCSKVLLAIDLLVESTLVLLAKIVILVSVSIFVGIAHEGFPFLIALFEPVWTCVQEVLAILSVRNEPPADEPLLQEEVLEENRVF